MARMTGAQVPLPDEDAIRRRFDELLYEEPADVSAIPDDRTALLREAYGLTGR